MYEAKMDWQYFRRIRQIKCNCTVTDADAEASDNEGNGLDTVKLR